MSRLGDLLVLVTSSQELKVALGRLDASIRSLTSSVREWNFHRHSDESFFEWSERLDKEDYLDAPEYRWEYQKATFRWVCTPLIWVWRKVGDTGER